MSKLNLPLAISAIMASSAMATLMVFPELWGRFTVTRKSFLPASPRGESPFSLNARGLRLMCSSTVPSNLVREVCLTRLTASVRG